jgi:hypothetical protein
MGYTISFYAMDSQAVARRLRESSEDLLKKIEEQLRRQAPECESERQNLLNAARGICRGEIPENCGVEYFLALTWLAGETSERVPICRFQEFRRLSYLDAVGIWPWFARFQPPFALPRGEDDGPQAGFLPWAEIDSFAFPEFFRLPATEDRDVLNARDEFRYVLETLVPDKLDLLAVLM